jgi:Dehydrogenase E1 component
MRADGMKAMRNGKQVDAGAPPIRWLISDAKLLALHRRLLKAVARSAREQKGIERYTAARIAIGFDLRAADTVIESAALRMGDALAVARRNKERRNRRVVVVWEGAAAADWQDALKETRALSLPLVFVCEACDGRQSPVRVMDGDLRNGQKLPSITVDGHDTVAAYRVAHEAIERARLDRGPTLIQLATYTIGSSRFTDPIADMDNYLRGRGLLKTRTNGLRN